MSLSNIISYAECSARERIALLADAGSAMPAASTSGCHPKHAS
jgi:hypothetical protein